MMARSCGWPPSGTIASLWQGEHFPGGGVIMERSRTSAWWPWPVVPAVAVVGRLQPQPGRREERVQRTPRVRARRTPELDAQVVRRAWLTPRRRGAADALGEGRQRQSD